MKYTITICLLALLLASCSGNEPKQQKAKETKTVQYKLATVQQGGVASVVKLPAQLAAFQEVSIFPKVNAYVKQVLVDIGSNVSAGTLLMVLEAPELEQAALQAREKYARTKADYSIDKERYNRLLEANKTPGAISPMDLSTVRVKLEADSALCNAEKANWQMQQTMLGYLQVRAPFAGTITERNVHPGALVNASVKDKPMLDLKQNSHLRLQVDVPETMSANLQQNDTVSFYVSSMPGKKMVGHVARKSSNINYQLRNERIEVDVPNNDGKLSSGMYADVALYTKGNNTALSVPKTAVVVSTERKYVIAVRNGKAQRVDVLTGSSTINSIEVFGELKTGEQVIENASDEIKEGTPIQ
jgi:RND family efflux transporter MFP subunit